jgi:hypothetical protein
MELVDRPHNTESRRTADRRPTHCRARSDAHRSGVERLVVELREVFQATGTVRSSGSLREWSNGNLHALHRTHGAGHRFSRRSKERARIHGRRAGDGRHQWRDGGGERARRPPRRRGARASPFSRWLGSASWRRPGALRLPSWARLRARQMAGIAPELALPPGAPKSPDTPPQS